MSLSALILQILKNRLGGHWEVSGSISRIDESKYYHGDCLHHLEGLIRVNDATCCMLSFWRMAAISLWAMTLHLNSHSRQLTGAQGPTYQQAGRWTTWGEMEKICFWNGQSHIPRASEMLKFLERLLLLAWMWEDKDNTILRSCKHVEKLSTDNVFDMLFKKKHSVQKLFYIFAICKVKRRWNAEKEAIVKLQPKFLPKKEKMKAFHLCFQQGFRTNDAHL